MTNLFNEGSLDNYLESLKIRLKDDVYRLVGDKDFSDTDNLTKDLLEKYLLEYPALQENEKTINHREISVDVSKDMSRDIRNRSQPSYAKGNLVTMNIPFLGDEKFLKLKSSRMITYPPKGEVINNEIHISYQKAGIDKKHIEEESKSLRLRMDGDISRIKEWLKWSCSDIKIYNDSLPDFIQNCIKNRIDNLRVDSKFIEALEIPLKERDNLPKTFKLPLVRKKLNPVVPEKKKEIRQEEWKISDEDYETILNIMKNMAYVMEQSPNAFKDLEEPDLRWHFLVQLNGQYEGQATGETFNYEGKTDILIKWQGKIAFIAECKFWDGLKKFEESIDQLMKYITWRDTKTAIIVFNRKRNFSNVLEKINETTKKHQCYEEELLIDKEEAKFKYMFHRKDDTEKKFTLTVLAFDVPSN